MEESQTCPFYYPFNWLFHQESPFNTRDGYSKSWLAPRSLAESPLPSSHSKQPKVKAADELRYVHIITNLNKAPLLSVRADLNKFIVPVSYTSLRCSRGPHGTGTIKQHNRIIIGLANRQDKVSKALPLLIIIHHPEVERVTSKELSLLYKTTWQTDT